MLLAGSLHAQTPVLVKDIHPTGDSYPSEMVVFKGRVIFDAEDDTHGRELWISDGTAAGTTLVKDINAGVGSANPKNLVVLNNKVIFTRGGTELWQTDGTEDGTTQISGGTFVSISDQGLLGNMMIFSMNDGTHGWELWKTDGTQEGTVMIKDINPSGNSLPSSFIEFNGMVYFAANDGVNSKELWRTDGTAEGTVMVADISPGSGGSAPAALTVMNGQIFFNANDGTHGYELWKSDGTAEGTVMVKDIRTGSAYGSPGAFAVFKDLLFFVAYTDESGWEPWATDGTEAGTYQLAETKPGVNTSGLGDVEFTPLNGSLLFAGADGQIWRTDGTPEGTTRLKEINPTGSAGIYNLTILGSYVYFSADDGTHGYELWRTDGTEAGTTLVHDLLPGSGHGDAWPMVRVGGSLFFGASGSTGGYELYMLEGGGMLDAASATYTSGQFQITVEGVSGQYLQVEATENFTSWDRIDSGFVTNGKLTVTDPDAGNHPNRSYRAKVVPAN